MKKQAYTLDDLITQARGNGIMDLNEIKLAILESSGELSVYKKIDYEKIILPVIVSGILIIVVVMFYPGGLAQLAVEIKGKIKTWIQKRRAKKYGTY